jgi:hypothetical protein
MFNDKQNENEAFAPLPGMIPIASISKKNGSQAGTPVPPLFYILESV